MSTNPSTTVLLIDASVYVFRAWHALPDSIVDPDGQPVGAVYGFAGFLAGLLASQRPGHIAAAFDESLAGSFRNRIYPAYKANRDPAPEDLKRQFQLCRRLTRALGVAEFASKRYEADDLIATWTRRAQAAGRPVTIVSRDKDFAQLLADGDALWDGLDGDRRDAAWFIERHGVAPAQWLDYQALVGDAVDNIPGVAGIGPRSASVLLQTFGSLEAIYANLDRVAELPVRGAAALHRKLDEGRDAAWLSRRLAELVDAPLRGGLDRLRWTGTRPRAWRRVCRELGFGERLQQQLGALPDAAAATLA